MTFCLGLLLAAAVLLWPGGGRQRLEALLRSTEEEDAGSAPPRVRELGVLLDLLAVALSSGLPPVRALAVLSDVTGHAGLAGVGRRLELEIMDKAPAHDQLSGEVTALLHFSHATGAPIAGLLHDRAKDLRSQSRRRAQGHAAALSVKLVVPLGVCILPAFFLLGVVPVVISLLGDTLSML